MRFSQTIFGLLFAVAALSGCEDTSPATQPAAGANSADNPAIAQEPPATDKPAPPTTRPAIVMLIDGEQKSFPPPRLVVEERNDKTVALLMSDDPPQAINDDYMGNSYYLEMEFDEVVPTVRGQVWLFQAPSTDKLDSPNGIFLDGNRKQLQPFEVKVQFQQIDGNDVAWISGTFQMYSSNQPAQSLPKTVSVTGRLPVKLPE